MNLLTCSTALPFLPSKRWNFGGLYPLGYGLPRSFGGNGESRENCLGIPESFSLSYSRRALTFASVKYWGLVLPPTADPPFGWVLSWLLIGGTLSLISCVLPSLRRRTSCFRSFNIAVIRAMGSSSYLACLCPDTISCSTRGTSPLYLEATSFSPTGSEAVGGTLVPLLFLCLGGMFCEGIASSLFFTQSPAESPKCESAFSVTLKPKDPGPNSCSLVDRVLIHCC